MALIKVGSDQWIDDNELSFNFIRSSGPGGQNVNKVSTAVQLSFDINNSKSLDQNIKKRLLNLVSNKVSRNGVLILKSDKYRTQAGNKKDVLEKFISLVSKSTIKIPTRRKTKPSKSSIEKRILKKKVQSQKKKNRSKKWSFE